MPGDHKKFVFIKGSKMSRVVHISDISDTGENIKFLANLDSETHIWCENYQLGSYIIKELETLSNNHQFKRKSSIIFDKLNTCPSCLASYYNIRENMTKQENDGISQIFDNKRLLRLLKTAENIDMTTITEILTYNWKCLCINEIKYHFIRLLKIFHKRESLLFSKMTFSLVLLTQCGDVDLLAHIAKTFKYLKKQDLLFLHTDEEEWENLMSYGSLDENYQPEKAVVTKQDWLLSTLIYLTLGTTYFTPDVLDYCNSIHDKTSDWSTKELCFRVCAAYLHRDKQEIEKCKNIYKSILIAPENPCSSYRGSMFLRDLNLTLIDQFKNFCKLGLQGEIIQYFSHKKDMMAQITTEILKCADDLKHNLEYFSSAFFRNLVVSLLRKEKLETVEKKFIKRSIDRFVQCIYVSLRESKTDVTRLHSSFLVWSEILSEASGKYGLFTDFIFLLIYEVEQLFFKLSNSDRLVDVFKSFKRKFLAVLDFNEETLSTEIVLCLDIIKTDFSTYNVYSMIFSPEEIKTLAKIASKMNIYYERFRSYPGCFEKFLLMVQKAAYVDFELFNEIFNFAWNNKQIDEILQTLTVLLPKIKFDVPIETTFLGSSEWLKILHRVQGCKTIYLEDFLFAYFSFLRINNVEILPHNQITEIRLFIEEYEMLEQDQSKQREIQQQKNSSLLTEYLEEQKRKAETKPEKLATFQEDNLNSAITNINQLNTTNSLNPVVPSHSQSNFSIIESGDCDILEIPNSSVKKHTPRYQNIIAFNQKPINIPNIQQIENPIQSIRSKEPRNDDFKEMISKYNAGVEEYYKNQHQKNSLSNESKHKGGSQITYNAQIERSMNLDRSTYIASKAHQERKLSNDPFLTLQKNPNTQMPARSRPLSATVTFPQNNKQQLNPSRNGTNDILHETKAKVLSYFNDNREYNKVAITSSKKIELALQEHEGPFTQEFFKKIFNLNFGDGQQIQTVRQIPPIFDSFSQYESVFEPLLLNECRGSILKAVSEISSTSAARCKFIDEASSGNFLELTFQVQETLPDMQIVLFSYRSPENVKKTPPFTTNDYFLGIVIDRIQEQETKVVVLTSTSILRPALNCGMFYYSLTSFSSFYREFMALKNLQFFPQLPSILVQRGKPELNQPLLNDMTLLNLYLEPEKLNESQNLAIRQVFSNKSYFSLIHGPPGTGKTRTIVSMVKMFFHTPLLNSFKKHIKFENGSPRILVCAPSNNAVDEITRRIIKLRFPDRISNQLKVLRVGVPSSINDDLADYTLDSIIEQDLERRRSQLGMQSLEYSAQEKMKKKFELLKESDVVCATLSSSAKEMIKIANISFDILIIDEACQSVETSTLIPFKFEPYKVILIGDPRQLPPTVISQSRPYQHCLFERLMKSYPSVFLKQQYRMHPLIVDFPNKYFYDNLLETPESVVYRHSPYSKIISPMAFIKTQTVDRVENSHSFMNLGEALVVSEIIQEITRRFNKQDLIGKIGVITPYKAQQYQIKTLIKRISPDIFDIVSVNTVDGFQGQEKDIIIISAVRSKNIGFMNDIRRMNVSITRAKFALIILGNIQALSKSDIWKSLIDHMNKNGMIFNDWKNIFLS